MHASMTSQLSPQSGQDVPTPQTDRLAVDAAAALMDGDRGPAMVLLVGFCTPESYRRRIVDLLQEHAPTNERSMAWALTQLRQAGDGLAWFARDAWKAETFTSDARKDDVAALAWTRFFVGDPWNTRAAWEAAYLGPVSGVFRAVMEARRLPGTVRTRCLDDLREAFFYAMISHPTSPGWAELAVRVVETCGDGPFSSMLGVLDAQSTERVAWGIAQRGSWRVTAAQLWPEAAVSSRAVRLKSLIPTDGDALLGFHLASRLIMAWSRNELLDAAGAERALKQNHGRARGRVRAILTETRPAELQAKLLGVESLHARTLAAIRRYAWAWAWQQLATDFAFDVERPVTPPCTHAPPDFAHFDVAANSALKTWILLVIMKGRLAHLRRWTFTGGTGDRDSTWARLIANELPDCLLDGERRRSYERLRVTLLDALPDFLDQLQPTLAAMADLSQGRDLRLRVTATLEPVWDDALGMPRSGFPTFVMNAKAVLGQLHTEQEDPCAS
jgi:hypothetical protein